MSELSFSNTSNTKNEYFSSNIFSIFFHFCFSIFSHPLYLSYFLFFSPYLLKLLSFLSPLFITTTLLLLVALLTFTPNLVHQKGSISTGTGSSSTSSSSSSSSSNYDVSKSKWGFFLSVLQTFLGWLLSESDDKDEEIGLLNELEAYLVMFQASIFEVFEPNSLEDSSEEAEGFEAAYEEFSDEGREVFSPIEEPKVNLDEVEHEATKPVSTEVKSLESLFQENALLENVSCEKGEKEVNTLDASKSNKVEESKEQWSMRSGSKVKGNNRDMYYGNKVTSNSDDGEHAFGGEAVKVRSQRLETNNLGSPHGSNLGSFGSMRVEKEWRRTLACKLFEERHNNGDGSEGMDMLWEAYETESNKVLKKNNTKKGKKSHEVEHIGQDEEEEEEEMDESKLCCLQALKFSTGKMNLGMGRPNLLKFSKALKGIGWLHHVGKHGKKNNH